MPSNFSLAGRLRAGILAVALVAPLGLQAGAPARADADSIHAAIAARRAELAKAMDLDIQASCRQLLDQSERALGQGWTELALSRLWSCWQQLGADQYRAARQGPAATAMDAFTKEWQQAGASIGERRARLGEKPAAGKPLMVQALVESALVTVDPYYRAARLYAQQTTPDYGLYYVGEAMAALDFAAFASTLDLTAPAAARAPRSLGEELAALDRDEVAAHKQSPEADALRGFINLNSVLKVAHDLEAAGAYSGALYEYLRARTLLDLIGAKGDPPARAALAGPLATWKARLAASTSDHSIGLMQWQSAADALGDRATADDLRRAAAILNDVLPRYWAIAGEANP